MLIKKSTVHVTKMANNYINFKATNKASHKLVETFSTEIKAKCTVDYSFYRL